MLDKAVSLAYQAMESTVFNVDTFTFVEIAPLNPLRRRQLLVPGSLLGSQESNVVALKRQDPLPKLAERICPLIPIKVNLNDLQILDNKLERIFAHAVARSHHNQHTGDLTAGSPPIDKDKLVDYSIGDQFVLMNEFSQHPKREIFTNVINLRTGRTGLIPSICLIFYPYAKVVEEFEWTTTGGEKVSNIIGDLFTIAHATWDMNWDPENKPGKKHPFTFGRNRRTGYTGLVRVQAIIKLEPDEIEIWKRSNLLPPPPSTPSLKRKRKRSDLGQEPCSHGYDCRRTTDTVAEFKRTHRIPDYKATIPIWRLVDSIYKIPIATNPSQVDRVGLNFQAWEFGVSSGSQS